MLLTGARPQGCRPGPGPGRQQPPGAPGCRQRLPGRRRPVRPRQKGPLLHHPSGRLGRRERRQRHKPAGSPGRPERNHQRGKSAKGYPAERVLVGEEAEQRLPPRRLHPDHERGLPPVGHSGGLLRDGGSAGF